MKKVFVLLLALALILPMGLIPTAKAEEVTVKPFYVMGWSDFDQKTYPLLDGLVQANFTSMGDRAKLSYNGATVTHSAADMEEQALKFAETLKKTMDARPAGARYLHTWAPAKIYRIAPKHAIYLDHAADQMAELMDVILKKYKEIGGQLDGIVVDVEYIGLSTYYLIDTSTDKQENNYIDNPNLLKQIVADPRYATEIRPMLEEWGFIFYEAETPEKQAQYTELYSITKSAGSKYARSRNVWNTVMRIHLNSYVTQWAYEPLMKYFPEANVSDYQSTDTAAWLRMTSVTDDGTVMTGGNSIKAGDTSTYSFYYGQPDGDMYNNLQKYTGYNDAYLPKNNFTQLKYYVNYGKYMYESTDTRKIAPWITYYSYGGQADHKISDGPYYSEQIFHLGMLNPQPFLSYTYKGDSVFKDGGVNSTHYHEIQQVQNELMVELTRVAGFSDREPIMMPMDWNSEYMLSGMYAGGRNIWRITPNMHLVSLENFKVEGTDPTFTVEGKTVTFPGGKIIEDGTVSKVGTYGYWVETAKDVMPVVTCDENRYEKYPSLLYNFEDYAEGKFDYNTSLPKNAWGFTWKKTEGGVKGDSTIVTIDGSKKLSIIGTSKNWIKEIPTNITAGDTFAKDQVWQMTVTVPEGAAAASEIVILNYEGKKQKVEDGGFKVAGGKLYYSEAGEYKELMDIAPGTYTFKREMNFHNADAFSCNYIVYDASGAELKKAQNVAAPIFDYITTIGVSVAEMDKAVLVDDFKIYVNGVAADFSLFDARTGQDAELNSIRNRNTAYRLSWLNATAKVETATLKADIYEGETLKETKVIKSVEMKPGTDGLETGIVEIAEGQSVKVYLESSIQTSGGSQNPGESGNNNGNNENKDDKKEEGGVSAALIAVIVAAVVAVAGVVLALVLTGKKKPAKKEDK